jgi:hypothetical protein
MARDTFYFTSSDENPAHFIDLFRRYYGPTMNAFEAAEKNATPGLYNWRRPPHLRTARTGSMLPSRRTATVCCSRPEVSPRASCSM